MRYLLSLIVLCAVLATPATAQWCYYRPSVVSPYYAYPVYRPYYTPPMRFYQPYRSFHQRQILFELQLMNDRAIFDSFKVD